MSLSAMKEELHQRLWAAQGRWFELHERGVTKHDLKMQGLRERGDSNFATRGLLFTGTTRLAYERELKPFVEFCHARGTAQNADINKSDMRDYLEDLIDRRVSASYLDKVKSAIVKLMAVYGKYESAHAMSRRFGTKIRELVASGDLSGAAHQRVTPQVSERTVNRLRELDERHQVRTGYLRGYHLAAELQSRCGLRAMEATCRLTAARLMDGYVSVDGKGGRQRQIPVPPDLYGRLCSFFGATAATRLAPLRAYESAVRRAVLHVGGRSTGTHARRRLWAESFRNERYRNYLSKGMDPKAASERAIADTLDSLGHGRDRWELRSAYLRAA